ncbi:hypothetical protein RLOC_00003721 [Lonchura striata]|uniref:Uncharacterized protein n=1 Tax=Lonchura striata TaxID=40157 RepID=A0A218VCU1_9PASE|nr:hypothetical protein RLOC_00003721 [Lonchura striata domestica]
MQSRLMHRLNF